MDKINNKNAREKALLEEAYGNVYSEGVNYGDTSGGAARRASAYRKQLQKAGAVRLQSPDGTSRATLPKDDPKIKELEAQGYKRVSIEDEQNPNADTWGDGMKGPFEAEDRGPGPEDEEAGEREDNIEYAKRHREHSENAKKVLSAVEDFRTMYTHELDAHAKGAGHPEDLNLNELKDAHDHLSRALHHLVDESGVDYIMGREEEQEYDMDLDPQGRREADPREW